MSTEDTRDNTVDEAPPTLRPVKPPSALWLLVLIAVIALAGFIGYRATDALLGSEIVAHIKSMSPFERGQIYIAVAIVAAAFILRRKED